MAVYIINFSDDTKASFTIAPGTVDGPDQSNRHTDLSLPGSGILDYGERVDENFIKLLENFASPENPIVPGTPDPLSGLIVNPIEGQLWFNNTTGVLFHYDGVDWKKLSGVTSGPVAPTNPEQGDLWYNTTIPQLNVYNGAAWDSVADRYVQKAGDTMTGFLMFDGGKAGFRTHDGFGNFQMAAGISSIQQGDVSNNAYINVTDAPIRWATNYEAALSGVVDDHSWAQLSLYPTALSVGKTIGSELDPMDATQYNFTATYLSVGNAKITSMADPTNPQDATTKFYVDNIVGTADHVLTTGDTMTGFLTLNADPTNPLHAATMQYVDDAISALGGTGGTFAVINPVIGTEKDGDIRVSGGVVEQRLGAVWKQTFPAVYS